MCSDGYIHNLKRTQTTHIIPHFIFSSELVSAEVLTLSPGKATIKLGLRLQNLGAKKFAKIVPPQKKKIDPKVLILIQTY